MQTFPRPCCFVEYFELSNTTNNCTEIGWWQFSFAHRSDFVVDFQYVWGIETVENGIIRVILRHKATCSTSTGFYYSKVSYMK